MTDFAVNYVDETIEILRALDLDAIDRVAAGLAAVRDGRRSTVRARGRGLGRPRIARGQRLPQALRHRGLRADRQRQRAHGPDQRRRMGDVARRAGSRCRASVRPTRCSCSRSAAATPSATSRRTSCARSSSPASVGASVYGIVGRDGGHTAAVADAVVVIPPLLLRADHAAHRRAVRGRVAPARLPSGAATRGDEVGAATVPRDRGRS